MGFSCVLMKFLEAFFNHCCACRRYLRSKRVENISQVGNDRIIDITFGSGDAENHIIMELYANGNIILTDHSYLILALLRSHEKEASDVTIKVGETYQFSVENNVDATDGSSGILSMEFDQVLGWALQKDQEHTSWQQENNVQSSNAAGKSSTKKEKVKKLTLKQLLLSKDSGVIHYGAEIIDHCILSASLLPSNKVTEVAVTSNQSAINDLLHQLRTTAPELLRRLSSVGSQGYIIYKAKDSSTISSTDTESDGRNHHHNKEYLEFLPYLFKQHADKQSIEFSSFDEAVDEYFCRFEDQKLEKQASQAEEQAKKKIEKVKLEQEKFIESLESKQKLMEDHAVLIESFAEDVDQAISWVNSCLAYGMAWNEINEMIASEKEDDHNPIAKMIMKIDYERGSMNLQLKNILLADDNDSSSTSSASSSDDEEDTATRNRARKAVNNNKKKVTKANEFVEVTIKLALSAHANARAMYTNKKQAAAKESKTIQAAVRSIKSVEESVMKSLHTQKLQRNLKAVRKVHWFEKFNWFLTTEGYLVLSGRDAQQNEMLVKRYLRAYDVYVHADVPGAASCIVRNKADATAVQATGATADDASQHRAAISPFAIQEAGIMAVCRSKAWSAKMITSAWWVWAHQVSKSAPSGEYLTTGSFMVTGKKNYLPPSALEFGFGVMFRLDDASAARHAQARKERLAKEVDDDTLSIMSEAFDKYGINLDSFEAVPTLVTASSAAIVLDQIKEEGDDEEVEEESVSHVAALTRNSVQYRSIGIDMNMPAIAIDHVNEITAPLTPETIPKDEEEEEDADDLNRSPVNNLMVPSQKPASKKNIPVSQPGPTASSSQKKHHQKKAKNKKSAWDDDDDNIKQMKSKKPPPAPLVEVGSSNNSKLKPNQSATSFHAAPAKKQQQSQQKQQQGSSKTEKTSRSSNLSPQKEQKLSKQQITIKPKQKAIQSRLDEAVRSKLIELASAGYFQLYHENQDSSGQTNTQDAYVVDLHENELEALTSFNKEDGLEILSRYQQACGEKRYIGNRSGLFASIMKRYAIDKKQHHQSHQPAAATSTEAHVAIDELGGGDEDEAEIDEESGAKDVDDADKLTGSPLADDVILYAVPVCGPYLSLQSFKYRVKLTPGMFIICLVNC
jgi:predicted ribosome quality control (RQC) complex YloA/Tae2 family protein